jgi:thymidylate kinase
MNKMLITLSGTHGTGKSTTAGACRYYLNRLGWKQAYIRQVDLLIPFGFVIKRGSQLLHVQPTELERMKPFRILWAVYILLIYLPFLRAGISFRHVLGYSVLCDRYIYDLIVTFRGKDIVTPFENLLPSLLPRPTISFVLDAPTDRILKYRPEHTRDLIEKEQRLYRQLTNRFHLRRIDASASATVVGKTILSQITSIVKQPAEIGPVMISERASK